MDAAVWIGASDGRASDDRLPGTYTWVTDEPFDFLPRGGFPTDTGTCTDDCPHCATINGRTNDSWSVDLCSISRPGVCEWESPAR